MSTLEKLNQVLFDDKKKLLNIDQTLYGCRDVCGQCWESEFLSVRRIMHYRAMNRTLLTIMTQNCWIIIETTNGIGEDTILVYAD